MKICVPQVKILAIDDGVPSKTATATLTVIVVDINDNAPRFLKDYRPVLPEHVPPRRVGSPSFSPLLSSLVLGSKKLFKLIRLRDSFFVKRHSQSGFPFGIVKHFI